MFERVNQKGEKSLKLRGVRPRRFGEYGGLLIIMSKACEYFRGLESIICDLKKRLRWYLTRSEVIRDLSISEIESQNI